MTQEEKAKRYDEAIERARYWEKYPTVWSSDDICQKLFPEPKESEDERIRKELINLVDIHALSEKQRDRWIAWLEKQDDSNKEYWRGYREGKKEILDKYSEHANFLNKIQIGDKVTRNEDGVLVNLSQLKRLAKQGEQKPTNIVEPRFKINDKVIHKETGKIWTIHWYLADTNSYYVIDEEELIHHYSEDVLKSAEQKPADKVEPKFYEGDWVVSDDKDVHDDYRVCKITKIDDGRYYIEGGDFLSESSLASYEYRPWTIEDAKDGDVLAYNDGSLTIFRYRLSGLDAGLYMSHILLTDKIEFKQTCAISNVHPATKEQRDLLFAKIKEAGYEWDAEKKELKKIEQKPQRIVSAEAKESMYDKPAWSEEDEHLFHAIINSLDREKLERTWKITDDVIGVWLNSFKNRLYLQHNQGWSEGDDNHFRMCLNILCGSEGEYAQYLKQEAIDWFKSLKDRVQPQPKQEWSEEDEEIIKSLISYLENEYGTSYTDEDKRLFTRQIEILKSLKDRYTWKPSERQKEALLWCVVHLGGADKQTLGELLEELNKL